MMTMVKVPKGGFGDDSLTSWAGSLYANGPYHKVGFLNTTLSSFVFHFPSSHPNFWLCRRLLSAWNSRLLRALIRALLGAVRDLHTCLWTDAI